VRAAGWLFRSVLIALGGAIGLTLAGVALLLALIDAGRFRPQIAAAVEAATGRSLQINGAVRLDLLPFPAIAVGDAGLVNPPGFAEPLLIRWRELALGARLGPLLRGQLELTRVRVTGLELRLERRADGSINWSGLGPVGSGDRNVAIALRAIDGLEIRDGRLLYVDALDATRIEFDEVRVDVPRWTPGAPLAIELGATWRPAAAPPLPLVVGSAVQSDGQSLRLSDTRLTLRWRADGQATGLAVELDAPRIEVDLERRTVSGAPLELRLGSARDPLTVRDWRAAAGEDGLSADATIALQSASLRRLLEESGLGAPLTSDPTVLGPWALAGTLRLERGGWRLEPLALRLDATTLRGRGSRLAGELFEIDLVGDRLDIGRYLEPAEAPTPPFEFPTVALRALPVRATLALETATLGDARLEGVTLRLTGDAQARSRRPTSQGAR
jgi:AsmA protein